MIYEVVLDKMALSHVSLCGSSLCVSLFLLNIHDQRKFLPMLQDGAAPPPPRLVSGGDLSPQCFRCCLQWCHGKRVDFVAGRVFYAVQIAAELVS